MFIDRVHLLLSAGKGGDGVAAFRREKFIAKGGPYGGDGGHGGSIILKASSHPFSLESFRNTKFIKAKNGASGGSNHRTGKNGPNCILELPLGTLVRDAASGKILFDFTSAEDSYIICKGGKGGKGNSHFKSPTNRTPQEFTLGTMGEEREVVFELKLIADIGLVGLPNAGKSTLISALTPSPAKIGAYPFTTLKPNLGQITFPSGEKAFIADIPGIIKNAHQNKGLGLDFLRHIERTRILVFVVDIFSTSLLEDFATLKHELASYNKDLLKKPSLVLLNKTDLPGQEQIIPLFTEKYPDVPFLTGSAKKKEGLDELTVSLEKLFVTQLKKKDEQEASSPASTAFSDQ